MKIICLKGGLGNQMFEYCRYKMIKEKAFLYYDSRKLKQHHNILISDVFSIDIPKNSLWIDILVWSIKLLRKFQIASFLYDDEKYKEALSIVRTLREKVYIPRDPKKWERKAYISKGITIFISSVITLIGLSNALLKYDYIELISYIIVIVLGIIFGLLQMANAEDYWTNEFYDYAMMIKKEKEKEEQTNGDSNR